MGCHGHFDTFEVTWETVCIQKSRGPNVKRKYTHLRNKVMNEHSKEKESSGDRGRTRSAQGTVSRKPRE